MESPLRARGALYGLAVGDASACPRDAFPRADPRPLGSAAAGFEPAPPGHPIAAGMPAGAVTDDTEQAVLLGRLLVKAMDHRSARTGDRPGPLGARHGRTRLPRPSRPLHQARRGGHPGRHPADEAGATGATNGAAMRITPVGIAMPAPPPASGSSPALSAWSTVW